MAGQVDHKSHVPYVWIVGGLGLVLALVVLGAIVCLCLRSSSCCTESRGNSKDSDAKTSHKFHILRNSSFCRASGRYICCKSGDCKQTTREVSDPQVVIPKGMR